MTICREMLVLALAWVCLYVTTRFCATVESIADVPYSGAL